MAGDTILQKPGPRAPAGLEQLNNIIRALLRKQGFASKHKSIKHRLEGNVLTALRGLARQLASNGLKSGKELQPTGTNGPLTYMLDTHVFPKEVELVIELGLIRGQARN